MERKWWTLIAVCVATFMLLLDITIVNVALPSIQSSLDAEPLEPPVGRRRLRADARLVPARLRLPRRPPRPAADLHASASPSSRSRRFCCGISDDPTVLNSSGRFRASAARRCSRPRWP